jgi:hypothetical protein
MRSGQKNDEFGRRNCEPSERKKSGKELKKKRKGLRRNESEMLVLLVFSMFINGSSENRAKREEELRIREQQREAEEAKYREEQVPPHVHSCVTS